MGRIRSRGRSRGNGALVLTLAAAVLVCQPSCYHLRLLELNGLLPSSAPRLAGNPAPSVDISVSGVVNPAGRLSADDGDHPDSAFVTECSPESCIVVKRPWEKYNVLWNVPPAKAGLSVGVTACRCLSGFAEAQYWYADGRHLYSVLAGFGVHTSRCRIGIRFDNAFRLTRLWYDAELWGDSAGAPVRGSGACMMPSHEADVSIATTHDMLGLRYYLCLGYAGLRIKADVPGSASGEDPVRTCFCLGHAGLGAFRQQGPWRFLLGVRLTREWAMKRMDQRYYWELDMSVSRSLALSRPVGSARDTTSEDR